MDTNDETFPFGKEQLARHGGRLREVRVQADVWVPLSLRSRRFDTRVVPLYRPFGDGVHTLTFDRVQWRPGRRSRWEVQVRLGLDEPTLAGGATLPHRERGDLVFLDRRGVPLPSKAVSCEGSSGGSDRAPAEQTYFVRTGAPPLVVWTYAPRFEHRSIEARFRDVQIPTAPARSHRGEGVQKSPNPS